MRHEAGATPGAKHLHITMLLKARKGNHEMNIAVVLAGGTGQRLGEDMPKQFVEVLGKPLVVYALEVYEKSRHIDAIEVVCIPHYIDTVKGYAETYGIHKLKWVVPGGDSCQESTRNGIFHLEGICSSEDVLVFGMSTSIFVNDDILGNSLDVCRQYGNAFAAMQCIYNLATTADGLASTSLERKEVHKTLNLPWTAPFGKLLELYRKAYAEDIETGPSAYVPTLFLAMGETLYLSKDTAKNKIHVTTPEDLDIVKGCLLLERMREGKTLHEVFNGH